MRLAFCLVFRKLTIESDYLCSLLLWIVSVLVTETTEVMSSFECIPLTTWDSGLKPGQDLPHARTTTLTSDRLRIRNSWLNKVIVILYLLQRPVVSVIVEKSVYLDAIVGLLVYDGDVVPAERLDDLYHGLGLVMVRRNGASEVLEPLLVAQLRGCWPIGDLQSRVLWVVTISLSTKYFQCPIYVYVMYMFKLYVSCLRVWNCMNTIK